MQGRIGPDHASRYAADEHDLASYQRAEMDLARLSAPMLLSTGGHTRLYVAAFDGTGNDKGNASLGPPTNVAILYDQVHGLAGDGHVAAGYVAGPGTQHRWLENKVDGATGHSYDARLEEMYLKFCQQAKRWINDDPDAIISLADVGFSRGAEEAAGFARMVHERGIRDPTGTQMHRDRDGLIDRIQYRTDLPPLRPPGSIAQTELLFDPVGTGDPSRHDRRPPPGVLSGLQIYAEDERRDLFASSHVIDPGPSADGRFLGVVVGGAHSNVGGGYREDGLSRRSLNLGIDYLNALSDRPFLQKTWLRPDLDVVVRSVDHAAIYDDDLYRANERAGLAEDRRRPGVECISGQPRRCPADGRDAQPVDPTLDARFPRRPVPIGPVPAAPDDLRDRLPASERDDLQPQAPSPGLLRRVLKPLADAGPPSSDPLVAQAEAAVRALEQRLGRGSDATSACMSASLACLAKSEGFTRIDAAVLSAAGDRVRAGENVFIVQGALSDPTNRVAHMRTQDAIAMPVDQSLRHMAALDVVSRATPAPAVERDRDPMQPPSHRITV